MISLCWDTLYVHSLFSSHITSNAENVVIIHADLQLKKAADQGFHTSFFKGFSFCLMS